MPYIFNINTLYLLTLASHTAYCSLEVVDSVNTVLQTFEYHKAKFGGLIPNSGFNLKGRLIYLQRMTNGTCDDYEPAAPVLNVNGDKSIALMERQGCQFVTMVYAAQKLNYSAVIVHNNATNGNKLVQMIGRSVSRHIENKILIPSVFVGYDSGMDLSRYTYDGTNNSEYSVLIKTGESDSSKPSKSSKSSIPVTAIVVTSVVIGVLLLSSIVIACVYYYRKNGGVLNRYIERHANRTTSSSVQTDIQLPAFTPIPVTSSLETLRHIRPTTFSRDDTFDVCPICLENFIAKENLWKLPCDHQFHINCILPCVESSEASCPVCRRTLCLTTV